LKVKAITIGSATIDIITSIANDDIERMTLHNSTSSFLLLEPGRKVDAESILTYTGGGAVNAGVSLKRQGYDVSTLVRIGKDLNGDKLLERFGEEGIDTGLVSIDTEHMTAVSVLLSAHDNNAAIFTHRGANGFLSDSDVDASLFEGADLVYVTNLSKASVELFPVVVERAKAAGAFVASNPGILQLTNKTGPFFDALKHIDMFTCNFREAAALVPQLVDRTGWDKDASDKAHQPSQFPKLTIQGFEVTLEDYMARVHSLGPKFVGVTDGGNGAYVSDGDRIQTQPVLPVTVVGTTGAGDSFASTLAGSLARGLGVEKACELAAKNAASVVSHLDAQTGLMTYDALIA